MTRVPVCKVVEVVLKVTLIRHVVGAVKVFGGVVVEFWQVLLAMLNGELAVKPVNVTEPVPVMLTVTVMGELTAGDVPVGMPKARLGGVNETVWAWSHWLADKRQQQIAKICILRRNPNPKSILEHALEISRAQELAVGK